MASRNKTELYLQYRHQKSATRPKFASPTKDPKVHLLESQENGTELDIELGGEKMKLTVPPEWMATIEKVTFNIDQIKENMEKLSDQHKIYLLPQFNVDDTVDDQQSIDILTNAITKIFQDTNARIQLIGKQAVGKQEEAMKKKIFNHLLL